MADIPMSKLMSRFGLFVGSLLLTIPAFSQGQQQIQPDVGFDFGPCSAACIVQFPNSIEGIGIRNWNVEYKSTGFSAVSLTLQGAPDSSGSPGTWVTYPGTVVVGTNPLTSTTGGFMALVVDPSNTAVWVRMNITSVTGTGSIHGRVYGYRNFPACVAPCTIAGKGGSGGGTVIPTFGTDSTAVTLSSSGLTKIISNGGGSTQIRLTHISVSFASSVDFQLEYGTGTNCGTSTTALTGVYKSVLTLALDFFLDPLLVPAADDLCVNLGAAVTGGGLAKSSTF